MPIVGRAIEGRGPKGGTGPSGLEQKSTEQLAAMVCAGQHIDECFAIIVHRLKARVFGLAMKRLKDPAEAEEAAQRTWVSAFSHISDYDPKIAPFGTWVGRICINHCLHMLRDRKRERGCIGRMALSCERACDGPELAYELKRDLASLEDGMQWLLERERNVLRLRYLGPEQRTYEEVGNMLGLTAEQARHYCRDAMVKLRRWFGRQE